MIKITNRKFNIPYIDRMIGVAGDNETTYREFVIDRIQGEIDLADYVPVIEIQPVDKKEPAYYDVLSYDVQDETITMRWDVKTHNTKDSGSLHFNIYFGSNEGDSLKVYQTYMDYFSIAKGIEGKEIGETMPPDIFEQAVIEATEQAQNSANSAKQAEDALSKFKAPSASATTIDSTQEASVVVDETDGQIKFKFEIPQGKTGDKGAKGDKGDSGEKGESGQDGFSPIVTIFPLDNGYRLTITDEQGAKSFDITDGTNGKDGLDGAKGNDGYSPTVDVSVIEGGYQISIIDANGTKELTVMDGKDGVDGADGQNGNDGRDGLDGEPGDSAYQVAVNNGFEGTEEDWVKSLKGEQGEDAYPLDIKELTYEDKAYPEVNQVYHMTIDKDCDFVLPEPKEGQIEQIFIIADVLFEDLYIEWGTEYFFGRCTPSIFKGEHNFVFESNGVCWYAGVMEKGLDDGSGGSGYIPSVTESIEKHNADRDAHAELFKAIVNDMGDIETALDNIITIQNTLIGGGS